MAVETADELHRTLQELEGLEGETPLVEAIQQAVDSAAALFHVTGCGVMFIDDGQVLHYAAASDGHGRELEQAQTRAGTGPCVQSLVTNEVVKTDDVTTDERWPEIHARAPRHARARGGRRPDPPRRDASPARSTRTATQSTSGTTPRSKGCRPTPS